MESFGENLDRGNEIPTLEEELSLLAREIENASAEILRLERSQANESGEAVAQIEQDILQRTNALNELKGREDELKAKLEKLREEGKEVFL